MDQEQRLVDAAVGPNRRGRGGRGRGRGLPHARGGGHRGRGRGQRGGRGQAYGLRQVVRPARRYGYDDDDQDNLQHDEHEDEHHYANEPEVLAEVPDVVREEVPQVAPQAAAPVAQDQLAAIQPLLQLVTQIFGQRVAPNPATQEEKRKIKIPDYDGTQCYTHFRAQFIALTSKMTEEEKGQRLLECLKGKAVTVLNMLEQQKKALTYVNLDEILTRTFTLPQSIWQRKRAFEELKQKPDQSLQDYAQDIERVGREYMVTHVESDLQEALVSQFIKGLLDRSAASKLAFAPVDTLQDAVKHLNRGLLLCGEEPPTKKVRLAEATAAKGPTGNEAAAGPSSASDDTTMSVLVNALKALTNTTIAKKEVQVRSAQGTAESDQGTQTRGRGRPRGTGRGRGRGTYNNPGNSTNGKGTCHYCGKDGHHAYECRKRLRDEGERQQGGYRGNGRGRGGYRQYAVPYFPPEAMHTAMALYRFQQEQQGNNGQHQGGQNQSGQNQGGQNQVTNNNNQRAIAMPYVPANRGNQGN